MVLSGNIYSKTLDMDTAVTIVAPRKIKKVKKYKVAYLLHGLTGNHSNWCDNTMLPIFAEEHDIIFVMPDAARSFYTNMKYGLRYFDYISEELPMICKNMFNISSKREDTGIIGLSMGGYGALKCALSKPHQYGVCGAFSSACLQLKEYFDSEDQQSFYEHEDFKNIFGESPLWSDEYGILELAEKRNTEPVKPKLYMTCGTEDFMHSDHIQFIDKLNQLDYDFTYEEWEGVHDWVFWNESLKRMLGKNLF